jgi:hypothetical protein
MGGPGALAVPRQPWNRLQCSLCSCSPLPFTVSDRKLTTLCSSGRAFPTPAFEYLQGASPACTS